MPLPHVRDFPVREEDLIDPGDLPPARGRQTRRGRGRPVTWVLVVVDGEARCSFCCEVALLTLRGARVDEAVRELRAFQQKHADCKPSKR